MLYISQSSYMSNLLPAFLISVWFSYLAWKGKQTHLKEKFVTCHFPIPVWLTASRNEHLTAGPGRRDAFTWGQEDPDPRYWSFQDQAAAGCHSYHVHGGVLSESILGILLEYSVTKLFLNQSWFPLPFSVLWLVGCTKSSVDRHHRHPARRFSGVAIPITHSFNAIPG